MDKQPKRFFFNYVYFGFLFFVLFCLIVFNFLNIENISSSRVFFLLYSIGQAFLEIGIVIFCSLIIKRYLPKIFFPIFIGLSFLYFLTHIVDFIMDRILDMTFWDTLDFVLDESFENLIEMLHASGVPLFIWIVLAGVVLLMPVLGYALYALAEKMSKKRTIYMNQDIFLQGLFCLPIALFIWDLSASRILNANDYNSYLRSLPWKKTFLQPKSVLLATYHPPKKPISEKTALAKISKERTPTHKPNIYLFIVESLRKDFINEENSPFLNQFKKKNIDFDCSFSGGNATQISWYTIFHSNFPFQWVTAKKTKWKIGSIPLKILKNLNYTIHVYSSAHLSYYGMDELLFGEERNLVDHFHLFPHYYPVQSCDADAQTIQKFQEYIEKNDAQEGQIHIFFWDSTHFDYSWPDDFPLKFKPISNDFTYFKAHHSHKDLEMIKNRYRNAIHFVDHLFSTFIQSLKNKQLYDDAVIVFTGDHGEEFMEHGHMFHNSELNHEQTSIPLYYKFKNSHKRIIPNVSLTSHMEIFPTLLDYIFGENHFSDAFEGDSIFDPLKWEYALTSRYNASRTPYEFCIHNGKIKLIARFKNRKNIFESKELQIIGIKDTMGKNIFKIPQEAEDYIWKEFGGAFNKIFNVNE